MAVPSFDYEAALLACAQEDQIAFQRLYQHEAPRMLALGLKMLSQRASAEELVRDAFILIWKNAGSYDPNISNARAWMYSIVRYRALGRLRQPGRAVPLTTVWTETLPDAAPGTAGNESSMLHALASIDESQRKPILMAFYNGLTYEQMAARLKLPAAEIKNRVEAGLTRITEVRSA